MDPIQSPKPDKFRDIFFVILFVIVLAVVGILGITVINLRAQTGAIAESVNSIERQLMTMAAVVAVRSPEQPTVPPPVSSTAWDNAIAKLPACGRLDGMVPDDRVLEILGLGNLIGDGYSLSSICLDDQHNHIPFIMAKRELTPPSPSSQPTPNSQMTCVGSCDKVIFGLLHPDTKILKYIESAHHLGIYGEAYDQQCYIDQILGQADADDETILLYCGSGESGGLTHWYQYEIKGDKLTEVQVLKDLGPPRSYDIKDPSLLEKFTIKVE